MIKLILLITILVSGCAFRMTKENRERFYNPIALESPVEGKIEVQAEKDVMFDTSETLIRQKIINEIKHGNQAFNENSNGFIYSFSFYKCIIDGYYPTDSEIKNGLISVVTLFLWPTGTTKTCSSKLIVTKIGDPTFKREFVSKINAIQGGNLLTFFSNAFIPWGNGVRELQARDLLVQFQDFSAKGK